MLQIAHQKVDAAKANAASRQKANDERRGLGRQFSYPRQIDQLKQSRAQDNGGREEETETSGRLPSQSSPQSGSDGRARARNTGENS